MKVICEKCGLRIQAKKGLKYLTCSSCNSSLKLIETESSFYTEILEEDFQKIDYKSYSSSNYEQIQLLDNAWEVEKDKYIEKGTFMCY